MSLTPRSIIVDQYCADEAQNYSRIQVLKSPAGYYLGTLHCEDGFMIDGITPKSGMQCPGSRDSDYFPTAETAQKLLDRLCNPDTAEMASWELRTSP